MAKDSTGRIGRAYKIARHCLRPAFARSPEGKHAAWAWDYGRQVESLRSGFAGEDCFLLCNGPSLNDVDFDLLADRHLIGLNKIQLLRKKFPAIRFSFHTAINELVIEQCHREFGDLGCPSFWAQSQVPNGVAPTANAIPIVTKTRRFSQGFTQDMMAEPVFHGHTVTFVALQIAFSLGFRQVFIVGMDHSFRAKGEANSRQKMEGEDHDHFDPSYFAGMQWDLPDLEGSELNYRIADFVYRRNERMVFDATEKGHCRIFERISLAEAMERCRPKGLGDPA